MLKYFVNCFSFKLVSGQFDSDYIMIIDPTEYILIKQGILAKGLCVHTNYKSSTDEGCWWSKR